MDGWTKAKRWPGRQHDKKLVGQPLNPSHVMAATAFVRLHLPAEATGCHRPVSLDRSAVARYNVAGGTVEVRQSAERRAHHLPAPAL